MLKVYAIEMFDPPDYIMSNSTSVTPKPRCSTHIRIETKQSEHIKNMPTICLTKVFMPFEIIRSSLVHPAGLRMHTVCPVLPSQLWQTVTP